MKQRGRPSPQRREPQLLVCCSVSWGCNAMEALALAGVCGQISWPPRRCPEFAHSCQYSASSVRLSVVYQCVPGGNAHDSPHATAAEGMEVAGMVLED